MMEEYSGDVGDLDAGIFRVGHWRVEVEALEVNVSEVCYFAREQHY
jgi:hypothetical protein